MRLFKSVAQVFGRNGRGAPVQRKPRPPLSRHLEALEERAVPALFGEFAVSNDSNNLFSSDTATSSNGMSVVVYNRNFAPGDNDVRAKLYAANGVQIGGEINVASSALSDLDPSVAMDANGNFVVAWTQNASSSNGNILARRFDNQGRAVDGLPIQVANTTKGERDADVAMNARGDFVVSYTQDFSTFDQNVLAARYSSTGARLGTVNVSSLGGVDESQSSAAMDSSGNFSVAYTSQANGANPDVKLKRFDANSALVGTTTVAGGNNREQNPSLAMDALGNMVVGFESFFGSDTQVHTRRVSNSGVLGGELFVGNFFNTDATDPEVALSSSGAYVVTYDFARANGTRAVRVTEVTADDRIRSGSEFLIETNGQFTTDPTVSIDASGNYTVSYSRNGDIFGRRGRLS